MRNGKKSSMPTLDTSPSIIMNQVAHGHRQWDGKDLGVGEGAVRRMVKGGGMRHL